MSGRTKVTKRFGVIPVPLYLRDVESCDLNCIYCPSYPHIPKSYIPNEDTLRARKFGFSPSLQLKYWLEKIESKFPMERFYKLELIILGGTFSKYDKEYIVNYFKEVFDALNQTSSYSFDEAKERNKEAKYRAVVVTVETRPDCITEEELQFFRFLGISKIELGIQSIFDDVLEFVGRPYTYRDIVHSSRLIKNFGFKIGYHLQLNLPFSNLDKDRYMLSEITRNNQLKPDFLKIYPTTLIKDKKYQRRLWELFERGIWIPYDFEDVVDMLVRFKKKVPDFIRIQRIGRQFENKNAIYSQSLRNILQQRLKETGDTCNCIRCQEINSLNYLNQRGVNGKVKILHKEITTEDIFIKAMTGDGVLLGYARVRIRSNHPVVREIKVLGNMSSIGDTRSWQQRGIGTMILAYIESLVSQLGYTSLSVIAAPGVYGFFQPMGYKENGFFLQKSLSARKEE